MVGVRCMVPLRVAAWARRRVFSHPCRLALSVGNLIYHCAATCVVLNIQAHTQTFYVEHTDDILSLTLNRNTRYPDVVASGQLGKNPAIHVWNLQTKEVRVTYRVAKPLGAPIYSRGCPLYALARYTAYRCPSMACV